MAKHKAPTQVTILREEKSTLQNTVDRFWKPVALITVVLSGMLVYNIWSNQQAGARAGAEWVPLDDALRDQDLAAIRAVRESSQGSKILPWALFGRGSSGPQSGQ